MSDIHDCGADASAYVLGALAPEEAARYARHIAECAVCREEVRSLRQLADVLPMGAPQYEVSAEVRNRILGEVRADARERAAVSRSRRRGWSLSAWGASVGRPAWGGSIARPAWGLVVAAVVAVAVVGGVEIGDHGHGTRVYGASVGDAIVRITDGHAELVVHHLAQPTSGHIYEVWLGHADGQVSPTTALFDVTRSGDASTDVPGDLRGVKVVKVTEEPAGGSPHPTSAPVVVDQLT